MLYNKFKKKKGQSTLEYAILIILIMAALLSMQIYMRRGIQGRLKQATDDIGGQYSPLNTNVVKKMTTESTSADTFGIDGIGVTKSTLVNDEVTTELMNSDVMNQTLEFWGTETP